MFSIFFICQESPVSCDRVNALRKQLELVRQRLQLVGIRHQEELAMTVNSLKSHAGGMQDSIGTALGEILGELQELQGALADGSVVS